MRISDWSSDVCSSDLGDARIDEKELIAKHAMGYPAAIDAGALTVMASFSSWQGVKHHGNKGLLTDALKEKMGFEGFVVGDWNDPGEVAGRSDERGVGKGCGETARSRWSRYHYK